MAQQTAMQALVEQMKINDIYKPCMPYLIEIIDEVYLPMEKEQIMKSFSVGNDCGYSFAQTEDSQQYNSGEQYYNETYKK